MPDLQPFENQSADHLRLVIETSQIGIWELALPSGVAVRNRTHDRIFGYDELPGEWTYDRFLDHVLAVDRTRVDELQKAAIAENREWLFECRIRTAQGDIRWIKAAGRPLTDREGQVVKLIGHVVDITDTKRNETRLRLISEELNHRVRNMLAMIKSMVKLSARGAADIPSFAAALEGRVGALARTHRLLVGERSDSMMPSTILHTELSALGGVGDQVEVTVTEELPLSSSASQGLALVFHELLTNAIKYGALSTTGGRVAVSIRGTGKSVLIDWAESGGPTVEQQGRKGFGLTLIAHALAPDGTVELRFAPEGLGCRIEVAAD